MKNEKDPAKIASYQEKIEQSGKLLLSIINNVLDMAHIESGKIKFSIELLDYDAIRKNYKPDLSDSVKNTYKKNVSDEEMKPLLRTLENEINWEILKKTKANSLSPLWPHFYFDESLKTKKKCHSGGVRCKSTGGKDMYVRSYTTEEEIRKEIERIEQGNGLYIYNWISIHPMLRFINATALTSLLYLSFQYIPCYGLSLIRWTWRLTIWNFNTSHVTVYLS